MKPISSESYSAAVTRDDAHELASFGYTQQLRRTMGSFSSFAVAFSLISVITGVTANFGHGLQLVGGGVLASWLIVLCGQTLLALLLAELSNRMPLSGYGYQWTSRLMNPHYGFFVGWLLMLQFITGFPGVCATLGSQLGQWLGGDWMDSRGFVVLTLGVITLTTLIHLFGIRLASLVNDTGVWTEMFGVLGVGTILIVHALMSQPSAAVLVDTTQLGSGDTAGMAAWALSLLVGAWCLTGFEAAADMAEETHQPRKVVPRAMLLSLLSSGLAGAVLIGGTLLAMPDLKEAQAMSDPLMQTLESVVGAGWMSVIRIVILISIFACGLACMSATSRLLFSLARDSMLPGSGWLARVSSAQGAPRNAILLIFLLSSLVIVFLPRLDMITQISAVAGYMGYAGIVLAVLITRVPPPTAGFRLGAARPVLGTLAFFWVLGVVLALTVPPSEIEGFETRHLPAWSTAGGCLLGLCVYWCLVRKRLLKGRAGPPRAAASSQQRI